MGGSGLKLADRRCQPHPAGAPALRGRALQPFLDQLPDWRVTDQRALSKTFLFPDFRTALSFINRVGAVAEEEGHHPDLHLAWGRVDVRTSTHDAGGLTENDFILAAKVDRTFFSSPDPSSVSAG